MFIDRLITRRNHIVNDLNFDPKPENCLEVSPQKEWCTEQINCWSFFQIRIYNAAWIRKPFLRSLPQSDFHHSISVATWSHHQIHPDISPSYPDWFLIKPPCLLLETSCNTILAGYISTKQNHPLWAIGLQITISNRCIISISIYICI